MLLTRIVDDRICHLQHGGQNVIVPTCRGREAAQVGSAVCIEVGTDFTLPYYRDLGVVLTIGMTPYEVLRTHVQYAQAAAIRAREEERARINLAPTGTGTGMGALQPVSYWGYAKHNMVAGPTPVSTQILHAAGIAFACKLRKGSAVTVAYSGDGANVEADFLEGLTFAAQHQLPAVFVYEQDSSTASLESLPAGLEYHALDGTDVIAVYEAMSAAMQQAREGHGPALLELQVHCQLPDSVSLEEESRNDPLQNCQRYMEQRDMWDAEWAAKLSTRLSNDVEQAMQDAVREQSNDEREE
jgi:2-oxoisovalerate dehydrogenase E1 component alpha subunit